MDYSSAIHLLKNPPTLAANLLGLDSYRTACLTVIQARRPGTFPIYMQLPPKATLQWSDICNNTTPMCRCGRRRLYLPIPGNSLYAPNPFTIPVNKTLLIMPFGGDHTTALVRMVLDKKTKRLTVSDSGRKQYPIPLATLAKNCKAGVSFHAIPIRNQQFNAFMVNKVDLNTSKIEVRLNKHASIGETTKRIKPHIC